MWELEREIREEEEDMRDAEERENKSNFFKKKVKVENIILMI